MGVRMTVVDQGFSFGDSEPLRFLALHEVERLTSIKKSTIYLMMKADKFPKNVPITARRKGWIEIILRRPFMLPGIP
jgi:predicted DNA-binding transcriptional regulator AlpA